MEEEIWKKIEEAPNYEVSNLGNIRHINRCSKPRPVIPSKKQSGYYEVGLSDRPNHRIWRLVHRIVLSTFNPVDNMKKLEVNHKDEDKANNKLSNLEWMTSKENCCYGSRGKRIWDNRKRNAVLCVETNIIYNNLKEASEKTGIHKTTICLAIKDYAAGGTIGHHTAGGYPWRYIENDKQ